MRVGILAHGFIGWAGGLDFLRLIICSLSYAENTEIHLLLPNKGPIYEMRMLARLFYSNIMHLIGKNALTFSTVDLTHLLSLRDGQRDKFYIHSIDYGIGPIVTAANKIRLDVLIPSIIPLPSNFPIPWVGYIYDFQHRYYPTYFSAKEIKKRDHQFSAMLENAKSIIVNSISVNNDIEKYYPNANALAFSLPFGAAPQLEWFEIDEYALKKYGIKKPYLIICNQFWKHKDHGTAFHGYSIVSKKYPDLDLVCTGSIEDYRDKNYYSKLVNLIDSYNLSSRIHVLGIIPKNDQISLLKNALMLLQPTLFEGGPGGGAVFDAVSLGIPCLISDIAVNKEITEPGVLYFESSSPHSLASQIHVMMSIASAYNPIPDNLIRDGKDRRLACCKTILEAINKAQNDS